MARIFFNIFKHVPIIAQQFTNSLEITENKTNTKLEIRCHNHKLSNKIDSFTMRFVLWVMTNRVWMKCAVSRRHTAVGTIWCRPSWCGAYMFPVGAAKRTGNARVHNARVTDDESDERQHDSVYRMSRYRTFVRLRGKWK